MRFENRANIAASGDAVWRLLNDLPALSRCVPGVSDVTAALDGSCSGVMALKVGPIALSFAAHFTIESSDAASHTLVMAGDAKEKRTGGSVKATTTVHLEPTGERTEMIVTTEAAILGKLGQFGQTVMQKKAEELMRTFAGNVASRI